MKDAVERALERFLQERGTKRGVMLTPAGAYFLYDGKFCSVESYHIRLKSGPYDWNSSDVPEPLFIGLTMPQKQLWAAIPEQPLTIERLRLVFHVACGVEPDELLRGLCFAKAGEVHFVMFSDPAIEELFLAAERDRTEPCPSVAPDLSLTELQQQCSRRGVQLLVKLYLQGKDIKGSLDKFR